MGELHSRYSRHSGGGGDEVSLIPKVCCYKCHGGLAESSHLDSVTHGAGGAATSMTVGRDESVALVVDGVHQRGGGRVAGIRFGVPLRLEERILRVYRRFQLIEKGDGPRKVVGQQSNGGVWFEFESEKIRINGSRGDATGINKLDRHDRTVSPKRSPSPYAFRGRVVFCCWSCFVVGRVLWWVGAELTSRSGRFAGRVQLRATERRRWA
jgi:hypothetical protein